MALIKSISGIRGTIGGKPGEGLTPIDIVKFTTAFGTIVQEQNQGTTIILGRDGRISGKMVRDLVAATLQGMGFDVIDLGLSTTPTVEMAVILEKAAAGVILTASHNPKEWNALKLLNHEGEFIDGETGEELLKRAENDDVLKYAEINKLGTITKDDSFMQKHIDAILAHPLVDAELIKQKNFSVVVDGINSTGATFVPALLKELGVDKITVLNEEVNGHFEHNPEPLPEHLRELSSVLEKGDAHLGIAVDPDVDR